MPVPTESSPARDSPAQESLGHQLLVTLCTFNERENIGRVIPCLLEYAPDAHVLVVDDNSPDGTGELAEEMRAANPAIHVLHRSGKLGLGTATVAAFQYAVNHNYQFVINLDADFSHHPKHIPALRECMQRVDVGVGSRYVPGGGVVGWNWMRHLMSRTINWYARLCLRLDLRDNSGSYRCYRVAKLAEIDFDLVRARGYAFQEEILYRCRRVGCTFAETPIIFEDRRFGESKINWKEVVAAGWWIFRLGMENILGCRVRKTDVSIEV